VGGGGEEGGGSWEGDTGVVMMLNHNGHILKLAEALVSNPEVRTALYMGTCRWGSRKCVEDKAMYRGVKCMCGGLWVPHAYVARRARVCDLASVTFAHMMKHSTAEAICIASFCTRSLPVDVDRCAKHTPPPPMPAFVQPATF
jgi:hypothetical protein